MLHGTILPPDDPQRGTLGRRGNPGAQAPSFVARIRARKYLRILGIYEISTTNGEKP